MRHPSRRKGDMVGLWKVAGIEMRAKGEITEILYTLQHAGRQVVGVQEEELWKYEGQ